MDCLLHLSVDYLSVLCRLSPCCRTQRVFLHLFVAFCVSAVNENLRFEVLTVVLLDIQVSWDVMPHHWPRISSCF